MGHCLLVTLKILNLQNGIVFDDFYAKNFKKRSCFKHQTSLFVKTWYLKQTLGWSKIHLFFFLKNLNVQLLYFKTPKIAF